MTEPRTERNRVEELAEDFLGRFRKGERPALSEYTQKHPELAEEIRELFPALVVMEEAGPGRNDRPAAFRGKITVDGQALRRLGEYRIVREIGRGGMGVVYEAEQEALGRHVALKVLPYDAASSPTCLTRFCREARAAARLHHTNIVPVFDVGEHEGVHYYAMQFIQGQGLDEVMKELRRLRGAKDELPRARGLSQDLASVLVSGQVGNASEPEEARTPAPKIKPPEAVSTPLADSATSATAPAPFYRSVAQLGLQVAEALAYAHREKVLHRDIKPSNLLLDLHGRIWVTDFGLAKQEGEDLTRAGDVVGTLRYMAPERFSGRSDARGDIYSLGLTLYELMTLKAAYDETDRGRLIRQITHVEPVAPRKLDRRVPRDLETIVLKAIAKEPGRRYQAADVLAEDLRRFLADRPVLARRTSWLGHARFWTRRNPGWAATLAGALALVVFAAIGGTIQNLHLQDALAKTRQAEAEKTDKLWTSYLEQARAKRTSGRIGQRFGCLAALRAAAQIRMTPELRDEAIAALALPDMEVVREWEGFPAGTGNADFDSAFQKYVRMDRYGGLTVCRVTENGEAIVHRLSPYGEPPFAGPWLSPDGRFVACGHGFAGRSSSFQCRVWQIDGAQPILVLDDAAGMYRTGISFRRDGRKLALGQDNGTVSIYDLPAGRRSLRFELESPPQALSFHPRNGPLAIATGNTVRILDTDTGRELGRLQHADPIKWVSGLAWHPNGKQLASGCDDRKIHIWDVTRCAEVMSPWVGHSGLGIVMAYNCSGDRLVTTDWTSHIRVWDTCTGRTILGGGALRFQVPKDDGVFAWDVNGTKIRLWSLAAGREMRIIRSTAAQGGEVFSSPVVDDDGHIVAAALEHSLRLCFFDVDSGRELASVSVGDEGLKPAYFQPHVGWVTAGAGGAFLWPVRTDAGECKRIAIGPPRLICPSSGPRVSSDREGRVSVAPQGNQALLLERGSPARRLVLGPQYDLRSTSISPDGRWVVTGSHWGDSRSPMAKIWDVATGRNVLDLPLFDSVVSQFSPDGHWLVTMCGGNCQFWEVGTWRKGVLLPGAALTFTPDSALAAVADFQGSVRLVEPDTGRQTLRLTSPEPAEYTRLCFTADGSRLIAASSMDQGLHVWDLRLIRRGLEELGLGADWPRALSFGERVSHQELDVTVDPGPLKGPVSPDDRLTVAVHTLQLAAFPLNAEAYYQRGRAYGRLVESSRAIADYSAYLMLSGPDDPRLPDVLLRRAGNLQRLNDYRGALADLKRLIQLDADAFAAPEPVAELLNQVARHYIIPTSSAATDVVGLAEKAVQLEPFNSSYQNTLGGALYRAGRYSEAIHYLEANALSNGTRAGLDWYFLALCHERQHHSDKARDCLARAESWKQKTADLSPAEMAEVTALRSECQSVHQGR